MPSVTNDSVGVSMSSNDQRPWTVLMYMVADHKGGGPVLDPFAEKELLAIVEAADLTGMHVAVQVDFKKKRGTIRGTVVPRDLESSGISTSIGGASSNEIKAFKEVVARNQNVVLRLERLPEQNAADPNVLKAFLRWAIDACPAKRYAIFFWGHSSGPLGLFFDNKPGETTANFVNLRAIEKVVSSALRQPADIVLFKDCCMSTFETAYQMQGVARFAIGSPSLIPIKGVWPYTDLFAILQATVEGNETFIARALAARLSSHYSVTQNRGGLANVPISL